MTNTRITDPEILERVYPVILRRFNLREGSGGKGKYIGGDGVIREMQFLENMRATEKQNKTTEKNREEQKRAENRKEVS